MGAERGEETTRRTVLRTAAAAGLLAGVGGLGRAQPTEVALDARVGGWVGRSPPAIAGGTNPTLTFEPGRTYRVTWTNADGVPHNFVVVDADGNRLVSTEIVAEQGASRTAEFEATPAMTEYYCEVHPQTMRGQVAVGSAGTTEGNGSATTENETAGNETAGTETTTERGPPPVLEEGPIVLGALAPYWLGLAPFGLQGRTNPPLRLREGTEYELVWINLDGVEHDFHAIDAGGADLADTSSRDDVGETHSTSFEATAELAEYYCEFHPQSMRGAFELV